MVTHHCRAPTGTGQPVTVTPGEDFPYWLKRAFGAKGALRAALARRPRAPNFTGTGPQEGSDAQKDTDAHELHGQHEALTARNPTHYRAADPTPDDLHAAPGIKGTPRRYAMTSGHP